MENVTFGELTAPRESRRSTTTGSAGYLLFGHSIDTFEEIEKFRMSPTVKKAFQEVLDVALPVYIDSASEVLGQDLSLIHI